MGWKTELIPVPYIGNYKKASVIILCLNPGYREKLDLDDYNNKYYFKENVKTLTMKSRVPFFFLDPKIDFSGGWDWKNNLVDIDAEYILDFTDNKFYQVI